MPKAVISDVGTAQSAVSKFNRLSNQKGQNFNLGKSNITGMKQAVAVSNLVVEDLAKLQTSIQ